jgi:hypothetical protein
VQLTSLALTTTGRIAALRSEHGYGKLTTFVPSVDDVRKSPIALPLTRFAHKIIDCGNDDPDLVGWGVRGTEDRGRALRREPALFNSASTFNSLIIVNKRVAVIAERKSLLSGAKRFST